MRRKQPRAAGAESRKRALSPYLANKQKEIFNFLGEAVFINLIYITGRCTQGDSKRLSITIFDN